MTIDRSW